MADLDREVREALEADGYKVESVSPTLGGDGVLRRSADPIRSPEVIWLAIYLVSRLGDELTGEMIRAALSKAKEVILRRRRQGDRRAQETEIVGVWVEDPSGGLAYLADSEHVDE